MARLDDRGDAAGDDEPPRTRKVEWRRRLGAARAARPAAERERAAATLVAHLRDLLHRDHVTAVAAYAPVGAEPGAPGLLAGLAGSGVRVLLPVAGPDRILDWCWYEGELVPARYGLMEPPGARLGPEAIGAVELVLVPALAIDRAGTRLGKGGGYYDRALRRLPVTTPTLAVLYDGELLDDPLPVEPHDVPVGAVVTPLLGRVSVG